MKEITVFVPEIENDVFRTEKEPFKKGGYVSTREEAIEIEQLYRGQVINDAVGRRWEEIVIALGSISNLETIDANIDKMIEYIKAMR